MTTTEAPIFLLPLFIFFIFTLKYTLSTLHYYNGICIAKKEIIPYSSIEYSSLE